MRKEGWLEIGIISLMFVTLLFVGWVGYDRARHEDERNDRKIELLEEIRDSLLGED